MPHLIFEDPQTGEETELVLEPRSLGLTIGRSPDCDLRICEASVGRTHAEIVYDQGEYAIRDLDSSNGTRVNGRRIDYHVLSVGDSIYIGDTRLGYNETASPKDSSGGADSSDDSRQAHGNGSNSIFQHFKNMVEGMFS